MTGGWSVRPATAADEARQAQIFDVCFRKDKDERTFRWKYRDNPHGAAISRVACAPDGTAVGGYSYVPRRFVRDGKPIVLMQASDAMTLPEWRGRGIFTGLDDIVCAEAGRQGISYAYAYSGRLSLKGFLGNGWKLIGHAPVWRLVLRSRRSLRRRGRLGPLLAAGAPALDLFLAGRARRLAATSVAGIEALDRFDAQADELSAACTPARGLWGLRDAAWLNWRYVDTPTRRQERFALRREGRLDGWLVAEFVQGNAFLVDHLARDEEARARLMAAFAALAAQRGMEEATALLFEHNPAVPHLQRLGFSCRRSRRKEFRDMFPFIVRACREDSPSEDLDIRRWQLADGDRDAEHMSS